MLFEMQKSIRYEEEGKKVQNRNALKMQETFRVW